MNALFHDVWGCGSGPIKTLATHTRLLCGLIAFSGCLALPVVALGGLVSEIALVSVWLLLCRPPRTILTAVTVLGLLLFLPYFLLVPFIATEESANANGWPNRFAVPWSVAIHGMAGLSISTATVASVTRSELRQGLLALPIPVIVSSILWQIVHQTAALAQETRSVAAAMLVRGAAGSVITSWRVLFALPKVWLPRVILRADRVAAAMDLRGFCENEFRSVVRSRMAMRDWCAILLALVVFAGTVLYRIGGFP